MEVDCVELTVPRMFPVLFPVCTLILPVTLAAVELHFAPWSVPVAVETLRDAVVIWLTGPIELAVPVERPLVLCSTASVVKLLEDVEFVATAVVFATVNEPPAPWPEPSTLDTLVLIDALCELDMSSFAERESFAELEVVSLLVLLLQVAVLFTATLKGLAALEEVSVELRPRPAAT